MLPPQKVILSSKGQLVLPKVLRDAAGLRAGCRLVLSLEPDGSIRAVPQRGSIETFFDALKGVPSEPGFDIDEAIGQAIKGLDDETRLS